MDLDEISLIIDIAEEKMDGAISHLQDVLTKLRTGKASPDILKGIMVTYYGAPTPLHQVANISTGDARTLLIQPWEKKTLGAIEKGLFEAQLGMTPQNDGQVIRLVIPPVTEESRKLLAKKARHSGEESKVGVRAARQKAMDELKKAVKAGFSEDLGKKEEAKVDALTKSYIDKVERYVDAKEREIMTV
jgi:ribosome recycling factor